MDKSKISVFTPAWRIMLLTVCVCCGQAMADDDVKMNVDVGRDPRAFKTAEEMHKTSPTTAYDNEAARLVKEVSTALKPPQTPKLLGLSPSDFIAAQALEYDAVWENMVKLNPYRKTGQVQACVDKWAGLIVARLSQDLSTVSDPDAFKKGNSFYRKSIEEAVVEYKKALVEVPTHLDARNNLALCQMHLGNDLIAQVELEICRQKAPNYLPAIVNLTVVYERLGLFDKAKASAEQAANMEKDLALATYNAAWYQSIGGDFEGAVNRLSSIPGSSNNKAKHGELSELSSQQLWANLGFWRKGVSGVCGARGRTGPMVIAVAVFLVGARLLTAIAARVGRGASYGQNGSTGFWTFVPLGAAWYILFWGLPGGGFWVLMIAFVLVVGGISASSAKS